MRTTQRKKKRRWKIPVALMIVPFLIIGVIVMAGMLIRRDFFMERLLPAVDPFPIKYAQYVEKYAALYEVDPAFIYAVIKTESSFNPDAISHQDAKGLMQVTGETFDWLNTKIGANREYQHDDLFDPELGIQYGTFFLAYLLDEFEGKTEVLAAYHAGRGITGKWLADEAYSSDGKTLDDIPYPATAHYVNKVLANYKGYQQRTPS